MSPLHRKSPCPRPFSERDHPSHTGQLGMALTMPGNTVAMSHIPCRDAAIAYIQLSFPPSPTHISFNGSVVNIDQITPVPIPDIIRREGTLTVPASTELRMRYWHLLDPQQSIPDLLTRCLAKGLPYSISSKL